VHVDISCAAAISGQNPQCGYHTGRPSTGSSHWHKLTPAPGANAVLATLNRRSPSQNHRVSTLRCSDGRLLYQFNRPADREHVFGIRTGAESDKALRRKALQRTAPQTRERVEAEADDFEPDNVQRCNELQWRFQSGWVSGTISATGWGWASRPSDLRRATLAYHRRACANRFPGGTFRSSRPPSEHEAGAEASHQFS